MLQYIAAYEVGYALHHYHHYQAECGAQITTGVRFLLYVSIMGALDYALPHFEERLCMPPPDKARLCMTPFWRKITFNTPPPQTYGAFNYVLLPYRNVRFFLTTHCPSQHLLSGIENGHTSFNLSFTSFIFILTLLSKVSSFT